MKIILTISALLIATFFVACDKDDDSKKVDDSPLAQLTLSEPLYLGMDAVELGATINSEGNSAVVARGFCWSNDPLPTLDDSYSINKVGPGIYTEEITGLPINTKFYARAYATNAFGTQYSNQITFKTLDYGVGNRYQGGIIAYVDGSGIHGFIVSDEDIGKGDWGCFGISIPGASSSSIGQGQSNTQAILNGCFERPIAASIANSYEKDFFGDWYLPTQDELAKIYEGKNKISGVNSTDLDGIYWTSTQSSAGFAWSLNFSSGLLISANKDSFLSVRPIRKF